ncbi:hypothetical protein BAOM_1512 [Peribacillus asahii]|uniref:Uncharacterized protein n=1 Tax=Peribacillus asahii TaxID=228899 RepID=A0A3Q9RLW3_9BACI|nr:hypothetical protein BAOM_1512 [Peribacillus asahii]
MQKFAPSCDMKISALSIVFQRCLFLGKSCKKERAQALALF